MRNVKGGDPNHGCGPGGSGGLCLVCSTPGGTETWCRNDGGSSAVSECNAIYPAYNGEGVSGDWGTCAGPTEPSEA
ncbi:MAG: hypothetical protein ABJD55_01720 [Flavobacteriaceae bacterium]